ncbi:MAG: hypothetical protein ABIH88_02775 [Patescibacteria group bacterium]|nr:hypothetical protein [Patescibacteria group bacterium]
MAKNKILSKTIKNIKKKKKGFLKIFFKKRSIKPSFFFLLPASFCILIGLTGIISFMLPKSNLERAKESLLRKNPAIETFVYLANNLLENSRFEEAEKIIKLAEGFDEDNLLKNIKEKQQNLDPKEIKKQIEYWEKVVKKKKDYRDAYLKLAILYFNLGDKKNSLENLKTAIEIDPNYDLGKKLLEELN